MRIVERPGPLLRERTTLRLGGRAAVEWRAPSAEALEDLPAAMVKHGLKFLALGRGSNLLVKDQPLNQAVLSLDLDPEPRVVAELDDRVSVRAAANTALPRLLGFLAKRGLSGLEGLAGVPGSVGGALVMNAGSFGHEFGRQLRRARIFSPETGLVWLSKDDVVLGYRHFSLQAETSWFVAAEAELELGRDDPEAIKARMRTNFQKKKASQPLTEHSAGCAFKNPAPEAPAGRLIEEAGLKGRALGGMAFSELHANFLVNRGGGTSEQALDLLRLARKKVLETSGHELELEVRVYPCCA